MNRARLFAVGSAWIAVLTSWTCARAEDVGAFFKDRTISLVVGSAPGGGYDLAARLVARHLPRHIAGAPTIVVRNMPGAGGILAARHLYTLAPRDGSTMGVLRNMVPLEPLLGTPQADYQASRFNWLGSLSVETGLLMVWSNSRFKSFEDVKQHEFTAAADGASSQAAFMSHLMNEVFHTRIKVVTGYTGQNDVYLAIERGEVDGYGITYWTSLTSTKPDWLEQKKVRFLLQFGPVRPDALRDVPYGPDLLHSEADRQLLRAAYSPLNFGRPFLLPPDVPPERLTAMRAAFSEMIVDPGFVAEAGRLGVPIDVPRTGEQLQAEIERVYAMPKPVLDRLRRVAQDR